MFIRTKLRSKTGDSWYIAIVIPTIHKLFLLKIVPCFFTFIFADMFINIFFDPSVVIIMDQFQNIVILKQKFGIKQIGTYLTSAVADAVCHSVLEMRPGNSCFIIKERMTEIMACGNYSRRQKYSYLE